MAKTELKPCPYRVHGERRASLTVSGEYYYNETFLPCMGAECPAFDERKTMCWRDGTGMDMRRADNG